MKRLVGTFLIIFNGIFLFAQKPVTIEDIVENQRFYEKKLEDIVVSKKSDVFYKLENNALVSYSFLNATPKDTIIDFEKDSFEDELKPEGFKLSNDEKKILFYAQSQALYRYSFYANYFIFDFETKQIKTIAQKEAIRDAQLSPDGSKIAYVKNNNLFVQDLKSLNIKQLTTDGKMDSLINGAPDWVYEEEFVLTSAFQWSPDGSHIAFLQFNESQVPEFILTYYDENNYPQQKKYKYPKAGENNSVVQLFSCNVSDGKLRKIETGTSQDHYIPRFGWTKNSNSLYYVVLNRNQNDLKINLAEINLGKIETLYAENSSKYIEIPEKYLLFFNEKNDLVFTSEKTGFNQLYFYDYQQKKLNKITNEAGEVVDVLDYNPKTNKVFFSLHDIPQNTIVKSVEIFSGKTEAIGATYGQNEATFNYDFSSCMLEHHDAKTPLVTTVFSFETNKTDSLLDNKDVLFDVSQNGVPLKEFFSFKTHDSITLNGWMLKPKNFDSNKKYPVLLYGYGGPGFQTVTDSWKIDWLNYLAMQDYIVVSVDNRGTIGRGAAFRNITYGNLGSLDVADQIETAKYMAKQNFVDASRIGFFGWSYGGYLSTMCILQGAAVFKAAIAVAPPIHWKFYDSVYTERYMGLPSSNPAGYETSSALAYTPFLKGKFLLIHGTTDDNVHLQNSMLLIDALIRDNKDFETFFYPNRNHSIKGGNTRLHLYKKMIKFLQDNL